ncbi:hypothetical protein [Chitinophaga sp. HK235]|uniref:hypothetical protein n=1 Tax=Chitinophaga sp. HK235 TaxID=2952571 RepID=UPI001BAA4DD5|nr:hypothetical protein [Chitinophaga sp. HK235]
MKFSLICKLSLLAVPLYFATTGCKKVYITNVYSDSCRTCCDTTKRDTTKHGTVIPTGPYVEKTVMLFGRPAFNGTSYPYRAFIAGRWTVNGTWYTYRSVFYTTVPLPVKDSSVLKSAKLKLYSDPHPAGNGDGTAANLGSNNAFYIRRVNGYQDITTISSIGWLNQPGTTTVNQVLVPHTNQGYLDLEVDVTDIVKQVIADGDKSGALGFMAQLVDESEQYNIRIFCSTDQADNTKFPRLVLQYKTK